MVYFVFVAGLMIPIRLATIDIVRMVERVGLIDSYWGLIPVYVAMSLPVAVFVLTGFVNEMPDDVFEAARIDGADEWAIYRRIVVPLLRPALSTVAVLTVLPIWNDMWFPLIITQSREQQTLMLGVTRAVRPVHVRLDGDPGHPHHRRRAGAGALPGPQPHSSSTV